MVYDALVAAEILPNTNSSSTTTPSEGSSSRDHTVPASNGNGKQHHAAAITTDSISDPLSSTEGDAENTSSGSDGSSSNDEHQEVPVVVGSGPAWSPRDPSCPAWSALWSSICEVWSSKWNHRAWLSRQSAGLPEEQLAVSVLIQQVCVCVRTHEAVCFWVGSGVVREL